MALLSVLTSLTVPVTLVEQALPLAVKVTLTVFEPAVVNTIFVLLLPGVSPPGLQR